MLRRSSAQERFAASVQHFKEDYPVLSPILDPLDSDPQMQSIWDLVASRPEEFRRQFIENIVGSAIISNDVRHRRDEVAGLLRHIAQTRSAVRSLRELGTKPVDLRPESKPVTLARILPELATVLRQADEVLSSYERRYSQELAHAPRKSRGSEAPRTDFMRWMAYFMRSLFEKPRYSDVATLTNVLFPASGADIATSETVRAADRKSGLFRGKRIAE